MKHNSLEKKKTSDGSGDRKEAQIERYLVKSLSHSGAMCIKFPPLFFAGFPDRVALLPGGVCVFIETKAPGKKPGALQRRIHDKLRRLGFRVEVIDSIDGVNHFIASL